MGSECCSGNENRQKGLLARLLKKLDRKLQEKSKQACCPSDDKGKNSGSSCCS